MGLFDNWFPKRSLDPGIKRRLIEAGKEDEVKALEESINAPSSKIEGGVRALQGLFSRDEGGAELRFEVEPGSGAEKRIKEIAVEEQERASRERAKREDFMRFEVGEGLSKEVQVLPGPRVSTAQALQRGEDVKVTTTPTGPRVSSATRAQFAIDRQIAIAKTRTDLLPSAEFRPGEKKAFAFRSIAQEAEGMELTEEQKKLQREGLTEFNKEFADVLSGGAVSVIKKPVKIVNSKIARNIGRKITTQRFRADKLDLPKENLLDIEKRLQALGLKNRTVRTFGEMEEAAIDLGIAPEQLIKETVSRRITDTEVVGLRNLINTNSDFITSAEKRITADGTLERALRPKIELAERQLNQSLKKLVKGGTEAGRAVVSFRIIAKNNLDADFWLRKAQKEMGKGDLTPDIQKGIRDLIDNKDVNGLAQFVGALRTPSMAEKGITLWKAGLLTSLTTHLANIGGNLTMKALKLASDIPATSLDMLTSLFTGKRTQTISAKTIGSSVRGFVKGVKNAKEFLRTGIYSDELLTKYDIPKNVSFKNKLLDGYTKGVFRTLGAEDILFRQSAMEESLEKQAWLIAKNEGLGGKLFKGRVAELLQKPNNEMVANAIDAAEWMTFQSDNVLADFITGAKGKVAGKIKTAKVQGKPTLAGETLLTASEIVAPFTKTPTNIAARIAEFSPLGFFKAMTRAIKPVNNRQAEVIDSFSKALTGTGIMWLGAYLADRGKMTGNIPTNAAERADFHRENKQPNSIRIGDSWFQLNRISPFGNLLALGAEVSEIREEEPELSRQVIRTGFEGLKGLTEQTFLKGVSGGLKAITDPERSAAKFMEQSIASTIPSIVGRVGRTLDPILRNPEGVKEKIFERIPLLREKLPPRRDIFGDKVGVPGGRLNLIDPFATKKAVDDPIVNEAKKIGVTIGMPNQSVSGVKMTNREYDIYQQFNGQLLQKTLDSIIEDESYQALSVVEKREVFEDTITTIKRTLNDTVFPTLMIKRMDLPEDTDLELLREAISQVEKHERTKNLSEEKKIKVIKQLVTP